MQHFVIHVPLCNKTTPLCNNLIQNSWIQQVQDSLYISVCCKRFVLQCQALEVLSSMIKLKVAKSTSSTSKFKLSQLNYIPGHFCNYWIQNWIQNSLLHRSYTYKDMSDIETFFKKIWRALIWLDTFWLFVLHP